MDWTYVQFSHKHPDLGELIRVLPGFFAERPKEFQSIADQKELYCTFFIVGASVRRKIFSAVGYAELPVASQKFQLFRTGIFNLAGKVEHWSLWDGEREWMVGRLTNE